MGLYWSLPVPASQPSCDAPAHDACRASAPPPALQRAAAQDTHTHTKHNRFPTPVLGSSTRIAHTHPHAAGRRLAHAQAAPPLLSPWSSPLSPRHGRASRRAPPALTSRRQRTSRSPNRCHQVRRPRWPACPACRPCSRHRPARRRERPCRGSCSHWHFLRLHPRRASGGRGA